MQTEFNDYLRLTRAYLKDYKKMKSAIELWRGERRELVDRLQVIGAGTAKYGDASSGGYSVLNNLERQVEDRMKLQKRVDTIDHDTHELAGLIRKLDNAIATLDAETQRILRAHYIEGRTWYDIADEQVASYDAVRQKGSRAIHDIARLIFSYSLFGAEQVILIPACG